MTCESEPKKSAEAKPESKPTGKFLVPVSVYENGVDTGKTEFIDLSDPEVASRLAESMLKQDGEFD